MREVYDGSWTRLVGTDGGKTLHWQGRIGFLGGCTQTIDRHHAVMGAMGERFALYRLRVDDADEHARRSLQHSGKESRMRSEMREAVTDLFASIDWTVEPRELTPTESETLVALAALTVKCRSAVERDGYMREIELIPDAEAPTRLVNQLARLLAGLRHIGTDDDQAWRIVHKVALDSIPDLRRNVLEQIIAGEQTTKGIATACDYPTTTTRRACEDLAAHHTITRSGDATGNADTWRATPWLKDRWRTTAWLSQTTVPEMSRGTSSNTPITLRVPRRKRSAFGGTSQIVGDLRSRGWRDRNVISTTGRAPDLPASSRIVEREAMPRRRHPPGWGAPRFGWGTG